MDFGRVKKTPIAMSCKNSTDIGHVEKQEAPAMEKQGGTSKDYYFDSYSHYGIHEVCQKAASID